MKSSRKEQHEYWKSLLELFFCDVEGGDLTLTSCRLSSFVGESCFDRVHKVAVLKTLFLLLAPGRSCRLREQVSVLKETSCEAWEETKKVICISIKVLHVRAFLSCSYCSSFSVSFKKPKSRFGFWCSSPLLRCR